MNPSAGVDDGGGDPRTQPPGLLSVWRQRIDPAVVGVLEQAAELGMIGTSAIGEAVDHALGFALVVEAELGGRPSSVLDLGTGGGLPGLVLSDRWPEARVVLLDSNERRAEFLRSRLPHLALGDSSVAPEVVRGRAEEVGHDPEFRGQFEIVTSRSFGRPGVTAECGAPLVSLGGLLVVSDPPGADPSRWPVEGLAEVGLGVGRPVRIEQRFGYQVLPKLEQTPDRYPRRIGVPSKRPLF